jgi:hypothetical protein
VRHPMRCGLCGELEFSAISRILDLVRSSERRLSVVGLLRHDTHESKLCIGPEIVLASLHVATSVFAPLVFAARLPRSGATAAPHAPGVRRI